MGNLNTILLVPTGFLHSAVHAGELDAVGIPLDIAAQRVDTADDRAAEGEVATRRLVDDKAVARPPASEETKPKPETKVDVADNKDAAPSVASE